MNYLFSYFAGGIKRVKPTATWSLSNALEYIREGRNRAKVEELRAATDPAVQDVKKSQLDYVTFSGVFTKRDSLYLESRSGLAMLDFDNVANVRETKLQLCTDPHVLACFISPRGNGLKVLLQVDPEADQRDAYLDAGLYFRKELGLLITVDKGCHDVTRATFLSYDPEVYHNPNATVYTYRGLQPPKESTTPKQRERYDRDKAQNHADWMGHITAIVERIEASSYDVTQSYDDWYLVGFALSVLGEEGRALFHRVSQFNPEYSERLADEKFDHALKTCRFTHPSKFFSICKDYGVDISRPVTSAKAGQDQSAKTGQDRSRVKASPKEDSKPNEKSKAEKKAELIYDSNGQLHPTVFYDHDGGITIKTGKFYEPICSNFQLFIKYQTEDEAEEITWILELRKDTGDSIFLEVPHEDFCSAGKLTNHVTGKTLALKLSPVQLGELRDYLFTKTKFSRAVKVLRYGYHVPSGVFFFANRAIVPGRADALTPDEFGIVENGGVHLSIPQGAKARQTRYTLTENRVGFNEFFRTYAGAHLHENAFFPACFYITSLFRDLALTHKNFSPILFLKGGAGTGKSSMIRVLTAAFGRKQEGVNLKSKNTDSALVKLMSQTSNALIWFDEYHNEFPHEGLLQAAYDNDGYHRSTDNTGIDTNAVEIHSALALTSNYLPENPIFFSRCVFVPITAAAKSEDQRNAFYQLEEWQEQGLGCLTVELLQHRAAITAGDNYAVAYDRLYNGLKAEFRGENVPERLFANLAQICAVPYLLQIWGHVALLEWECVDEQEVLGAFVEMGAASIRRQHRIQSEKTALAEFMEVIQTLYDAGLVQEEVHFRYDGTDILLWFPQLYNLYAQRFRMIFQRQPADRDTLQSELAAACGKSDWSDIAKHIRFRSDGESNSQRQSESRKNSCTVPYEVLTEKYGLDFGPRKAKSFGV